MAGSAINRSEDETMGLGPLHNPIDVSVILPAYNEAESIDGIYSQVVGVLDPTDYSYEILFIDDGSTDGTWAKIQALAAKDNRVRALKHRRNFGKASALANGFTYARGEIMVTSDADMQYDPHDIIRLVDKVCEGYDVVSAEKVLRRDPLSKRLPSKFFNFFVRRTTGVDLHDFNAGLKAYWHDAAEDLVRYGYGELHRFFILLAARRGYAVAEVPVESCYRIKGHSKYGMERYLRGALDYFTVVFLSMYSERPLHLIGAAGFVLCGLGTVLLLVVLGVAMFVQHVVPSSSVLQIAALLIVTGIQLFVVGLLAEMLNNLEHKSAGRSKIAQVIRIDRRETVAPGQEVQVEWRHSGLRSMGHPAESVVEHVEAMPGEAGVLSARDSSAGGPE